MNERKRLTEIKIQCAKLDTDVRTIHSKINKLEEETARLKFAIVKSEHLFGEAPWTLIISKEGCVSLIANANKFPKLVDLCSTAWDQVRLYLPEKKGMQFYEHDGDMSIDFFDKSKYKQFIQEHGITVDLSHAAENIEGLEKALKVYQEASKGVMKNECSESRKRV